METFEVPFFNNSLQVTLSAQGLVEVIWRKNKIKKNSRTSKSQKDFEAQLQDYLSGQAPLNLKVDWPRLPGTAFQKSVWKKMAQIPFGKTKSYGDIAHSLNKPGASRAVGSACGKNPVLLAIPCHRVVGSNGLGGFSGGGLRVKRQLLQLEGHDHFQ